jgi:dTDP-4-amino-4,6-dideoxygalactose transaminase
MLYGKHPAAPDPAQFETIRYEMPNVSGRMDYLRAAILRPQLKTLDQQIERWNERYVAVERGLRDTPGLTVVERPEDEFYVGSSIQFLLLDWGAAKVERVLSACIDRGVELKWFGATEPKGFTSRYDSWRYASPQSLPQSDRILGAVMDMRLPLTFSVDDCKLIARIIRDVVSQVHQSPE